MIQDTPPLYLRLRKKVKIARGAPIMLGHIAQMITEPEYEDSLKRIVLHRPAERDGNIILIDMLMIIKHIREIHPHLRVEHLGDPHVLVEINRDTRAPNVILVALVWLLLFIGAGLAIMNFHADVSMLEVHQRMYKLITGKAMEHPLILQIPYSLGIGLGMVLFFNHLFKKKINDEPSPLEVEMFMYEENVNKYVVTEEYCRNSDKGRDF